jgi:myosin-5
MTSASASTSEQEPELDPAAWVLPPMTDARYLSQSGCYERQDGVADIASYERTRSAMSVMGLSLNEQAESFVIAAAVIHLGNLAFNEVAASHGGGGEAGSNLAGVSRSESVTPEAEAATNAVCQLLQLEPAALEATLCSRTIVAGGEKHVIRNSCTRASDGRHAVAKAIYGRLFSWLVARINFSLNQQQSTATDASSKALSFIGVLDIFGFEVFKKNGFEQLCINYANEKLQQQFNAFVFRTEQREYEEEKIEWSFIDFPDNQECLELIEGDRKHGVPGLLPMLDEECLFPQGSDQALANKMYQRLPYNTKAMSGHKRFQASAKHKSGLKFVVSHYAGTVCYTTEGFCERNKDQLQQDSVDLLRSSTLPFLQQLFTEESPAKQEQQQPQRRRSAIMADSVSSQFRGQLAHLLQTIHSTSPHYIRCLKPNDRHVSGELNRRRLLEQLRCGGVLEAVRVARCGYPIRLSHSDFVKRYYMFASSNTARPVLSDTEAAKEVAWGVLLPCVHRLTGEADSACVSTKNTPYDADKAKSVCSDSGIQFGRSKIFFRRGAYNNLEAQRTARLLAATLSTQAWLRGICHARAFRQQRAASTVLCSVLYRAAVARQLVHALRCTSKAIKVQAWWRSTAQLRWLKTLNLLAIRLQAHQRGGLVREEICKNREQQAATTLQRRMRAWHCKCAWAKKVRAVVALQCSFRCRLACQQRRQIFAKARDVAAITGQMKEVQRVAAAEREGRLAMEKEVAALRATVVQQQADTTERLRLEKSREEAQVEAEEKDSELKRLKEQVESMTRAKEAEEERRRESKERVKFDAAKKRHEATEVERREWEETMRKEVEKKMRKEVEEKVRKETEEKIRKEIGEAMEKEMNVARAQEQERAEEQAREHAKETEIAAKKRQVEEQQTRREFQEQNQKEMMEQAKQVQEHARKEIEAEGDQARMEAEVKALREQMTKAKEAEKRASKELEAVERANKKAAEKVKLEVEQVKQEAEEKLKREVELVKKKTADEARLNVAAVPLAIDAKAQQPSQRKQAQESLSSPQLQKHLQTQSTAGSMTPEQMAQIVSQHNEQQRRRREIDDLLGRSKPRTKSQTKLQTMALTPNQGIATSTSRAAAAAAAAAAEVSATTGVAASLTDQALHRERSYLVSSIKKVLLQNTLPIALGTLSGEIKRVTGSAWGAKWQAKHGDLPAFIKALPKATNITLIRGRAVTLAKAFPHEGCDNEVAVAGVSPPPPTPNTTPTSSTIIATSAARARALSKNAAPAAAPSLCPQLQDLVPAQMKQAVVIARMRNAALEAFVSETPQAPVDTQASAKRGVNPFDGASLFAELVSPELLLQQQMKENSAAATNVPARNKAAPLAKWSLTASVIAAQSPELWGEFSTAPAVTTAVPMRAVRMAQQQAPQRQQSEPPNTDWTQSIEQMQEAMGQIPAEVLLRYLNTAGGNVQAALNSYFEDAARQGTLSPGKKTPRDATAGGRVLATKIGASRSKYGQLPSATDVAPKNSRYWRQGPSHVSELHAPPGTPKQRDAL